MFPKYFIIIFIDYISLFCLNEYLIPVKDVFKEVLLFFYVLACMNTVYSVYKNVYSLDYFISWMK